jgi:molecular chaperone GrpE
MDEKANAGKPLRSTSNKLKDLYNTYVRQEEGRTIPIYSTDQSGKPVDENTETPGSKEIIDNILQFSETEQSQDIENSPINEMLDRIEEMDKERNELKDQLMRKAAELENIRRRSLKEKQEMIDYANERLLLKILPIIDDLGNAIQSGRKNQDYESLITGIELIYQKTLKTFEEAGVKPVDNSVGQPFDVNLHEAVMMMPSDEPEGTVVQEVQTGYKLFDKVIRHTKVITSSGQSN